jgi:hypothetical protein
MATKSSGREGENQEQEQVQVQQQVDRKWKGRAAGHAPDSYGPNPVLINVQALESLGGSRVKAARREDGNSMIPLPASFSGLGLGNPLLPVAGACACKSDSDRVCRIEDILVNVKRCNAMMGSRLSTTAAQQLGIAGSCRLRDRQ